jgi:hypothetical protein
MELGRIPVYEREDEPTEAEPALVLVQEHWCTACRMYVPDDHLTNPQGYTSWGEPTRRRHGQD